MVHKASIIFKIPGSDGAQVATGRDDGGGDDGYQNGADRCGDDRGGKERELVSCGERTGGPVRVE